MKLDRNNNADGKGKYALINLRTNAVEWGLDEQFFVIKYKDEFAEDALRAYAHAVRERINVEMDALSGVNNVEMRPAIKAVVESLREFAREIDGEADKARDWPTKKLPD